MKRRQMYIGPGAASLILLIVVVSMTVLGLLALMSARGDMKLIQRSRQFTAAEYEASARAEQTLAGLDALLARCTQTASTEDAYLLAVGRELPDGLSMEGRLIRWTEDGGVGRALACEVELAPLGDFPHYIWKEHAFQTEYEDAFLE